MLMIIVKAQFPSCLGSQKLPSHFHLSGPNSLRPQALLRPHHFPPLNFPNDLPTAVDRMGAWVQIPVKLVGSWWGVA